MKKIAIIGSGISGLTAAYYLNKVHDICLYESDNRLGGHTATKTIQVNGATHAIDTGFIVFNDWTYPNFMRLLKEINVESQPTSMGFSVSDPLQDYEYAGTNLFTLFAKKRTLFSRHHWAMLRDIVRFNKEAQDDLSSGQLLPKESLGNYLTRHGYSQQFRDYYLIPMGAAIWSATPGAMLEFPVEFFIRFFSNHGLLNVMNRPQWHVIKGGSQAYIEPLTRLFSHRIRLNSQVTQIKRSEHDVFITANGITERFDEVVIACHSDQALHMLTDASIDEKKILGAIPYQKNAVVLHTDTSLLPRRKSTWSSWNYQISADKQQPPILTYSMNILQGIHSSTEFCVTLNAKEHIHKNTILGEYEYAHPVFSQAAINAQGQWHSINGVNRTWYCGAYWFNGFHEDGVKSALRVAQALGVHTE